MRFSTPKSLHPTPVGRLSSAFAVDIFHPVWPSLGCIERMHPNPNYRRFVRNVAIVGGGAAILDICSGPVGLGELLLQTVLTLCAGVYGLFGGGKDDGDDTGLPA